jgi:predicted RND superfamily exporter protein
MTILDSNITTIIVTIILFFLGTGPIKGFAITLLLGVIVSMICSLVVTRSLAKTYLYINPNNEKRLRLKTPVAEQGERGNGEQEEKRGGKSAPAPKRRLNT